MANTNKINHITIQQYLSGRLGTEAMHELEKQALDDPFLADALEGYSNIDVAADKQLSLLQTQLRERIAKQQQDRSVQSFSWQRLSIAAAAGLLFITASILFWMKEQKKQEQLALQPREVEVNLTLLDTGNNKALYNSDTYAEPVIGWRKYNSYLQQNKKLSSKHLMKGDVVVTFTIGSAKQLQNFKIVKGLNPQTDKEAIRLIKEGPAWKTGKSSTGRVTVSFK